tara:strand:+ start:281 stop:925 length:645 start_codon:yes stop_codon:yes gene_type:complete
MKDNLIFILVVFFMVVIIMFFFPNFKNKKIKIEKNNKILKVETDPEYAAIVSQNNNSKNSINSMNSINSKKSPSSSDIITEFKIKNIKLLDMERQEKNTFIFNEIIYIIFDYELPKGYFTFQIETIPDVKIQINKDILRTGKGSTAEKPVLLKVNYGLNMEDIILEKINILVYKTTDFENPVFNYVKDVNITIKNLNVNLVREEDYTTPLLINR